MYIIHNMSIYKCSSLFDMVILYIYLIQKIFAHIYTFRATFSYSLDTIILTSLSVKGQIIQVA